MWLWVFTKKRYKKHFLRKTVCAPIVNDTPFDSLLNDLEENTRDRKYECERCKKRFASRQSKYYHKKKCTHDVNVQIDAEMQLVHTLIDEVSSLKDRIVQLETTPRATTSTTYNIYNYVIMRDFGNENRDDVPYLSQL
jgi:hypothetical protein